MAAQIKRHKPLARYLLSAYVSSYTSTEMTYLKFAYVVKSQIMMGFAFIGPVNVVVVVKHFHLLGHAITAKSSWRLQSGGSSVMHRCWRGRRMHLAHCGFASF